MTMPMLRCSAGILLWLRGHDQDAKGVGSGNGLCPSP